MQKIINVWIENTMKMIIGKTFVFSIFAALLIFLTTNIYTEPIKGKEYNLLSLIIAEDSKEIINDAPIIWDEIFLGGSNGYIWLFAPIIVALPYISTVSAGKSDSNVRFEIIRSGKFAYVVGRLLAVLGIGGLIISLSYSIYGLIMYLVLNQAGQYDIIQSNSLLILKKILSMYIYGAISMILSYMLSAIIRNKYIMMCIPFVFNYFFTMYISEINLYNFTENYILKRIVKYSVVTNSQYLLFENKKEVVVGIVFYLFIIIIAGVLFREVLERKEDCGDN